MKSKKVHLRQEVFEADAYKIAAWLEDQEVSKYLNEHQNVSKSIRLVLQRMNMPILTHVFNQNGSFFVILEEQLPIGFLRLVPKGKMAEMVIVIGDKEKWGLGLGKNAIIQGLNHAFFSWRVDSVIAKINYKNERSIRVFRRVGFKPDRELAKEIQYSITMEDFLKIS
ncbi:GNAT family N-acetyltransferase [Lutispora thermophila]|uniref:Protein N-acetyltransferase, RimJ/RimL family n=1 Tax=Lutispora thermophila DSM 19022 TaxID=1122184 RepID=A0A1M6CAT6_9FIRM|nr:GNAT family N-acetyltransferase [Lutispora thermophila]SHI58106.1 Protein N-acetyltransferase, RimJ/RimL family [Lutispora thermophila DSM 19022]